MKRELARFGVTAWLSLLAVPAFAHPGHGSDGGSHELVHYLTEGEHLARLAMAAAAGAVTSMLVAWYRRRV